MKTKRIPLLGLSGLVAVLTTHDAFSVKITWNGNTDNDFNTGSNWIGGTAPGSGDIAVLAIDTNTTLSADKTIGGIEAKSQSIHTLDASSSTLTLVNPTAISVKNSGIEGSDLALTGKIHFGGAGNQVIETLGASTLDLNGATLSGTNKVLEFTGAGQTTMSNSTIESSFLYVGISHEGIIIDGNNAIATTLILNDASLEFSSPSDKLSVTGSLLTTVPGGADWVFDLANTDSDHVYIDAATITSLDSTNLNVSNIEWSVNDFNPVILAEYESLGSGTEFASVTGLLPGQRISYNYRGLNQIAIVPEPSLALPILAGFLPLFGFRRRSRR